MLSPERPTIVDFLENAMSASTEEISRVVRATPELAVRRMDETYALLEDTWIDSELEEQRASELRGELWPVLPSMSVDVVGLARAKRQDQPQLGRSSASRKTKVITQSLLLYAHGIHMPNPLLVQRTDLTPKARFLNAVADICVLAPLIRGGVARIHKPLADPLSMVTDEVRDKMDDWGGRLGRAMRAYEGHRQVLHQGLLRQGGDALLSRALANILDFSHRGEEIRGSLLFPTEYDSATLSMIAEEFGAVPGSQRPETIRLNQLVRLSLPGLNALELRDMVNIRSDDSFGVFRADIADAMTNADSDIERGALDLATRTIAEHMDAGLAKLNTTTRAGLLKETTIPDLIGWGVGAASAVSLAGWQGFVATLFGKAAADLVMQRPTVGQRALSSHYVELGTSSLNFQKGGTFVAPAETDLREMHTDRSEARRRLLQRLREDAD
jgi:hypothetical protein